MEELQSAVASLLETTGAKCIETLSIYLIAQTETILRAKN